LQHVAEDDAMTLEPTTQKFIDSLRGAPLNQLDAGAAHKVLTDLQSQPVELQDAHAHIEDTTWPVGPTGSTKIIVEGDILQSEGERYANKLSEAGVRVTSVRYNETNHDFVMLNPLANTPAVRAATAQAISALQRALA
jgi:acetyl esterase/lipase